MTAQDVLAALLVKWPPKNYIHVHEAPSQADRGGTKIDALIISPWASRRFPREAVEVKVTRSDWQRELAQIGKAEWWFVRSNRFWLAVPAPHGDIVRAGELPADWGLLECTADACTVIKEAVRHEAEAIGEGTWIGLIRAAANCSLSVLMTTEQRGYARGFKAGEEQSANGSIEGRFERRYNKLQSLVAEFESASGISLSRYAGGTHLGKLVDVLLRANHFPRDVCAPLRQNARLLRNAADALDHDAKRIEAEAAGSEV